MSECGCELEIDSREQSRVLWAVLAINLFMFFAEAGAGLLAGSVALIADSFDMLADATVYGVSLFAVTRTLRTRALAATVSGCFQIGLGGLVILETLRRLFAPAEPEPLFMIGVSMVALVANVICLKLISAHKDGGVHMRASVIFSQNDVLANLSVVFGGLVVAATRWHQVDLLVGAGIALLVASGGIRILREARSALRSGGRANTVGAA